MSDECSRLAAKLGQFCSKCLAVLVTRSVGEKDPYAGRSQPQSLGASKRAERRGEQHILALDSHDGSPLQDIRDLLHRGLGDLFVEHNLPARHGDNTIA